MRESLENCITQVKKMSLHKQDDNISTESTNTMSTLLDRVKGTYIIDNTYNM